MTHYIYAIYDKIADVYNIQILDKDPSVVKEGHIRSLKVLTHKKSPDVETMKGHNLMLVGQFDDSTANIDLLKEKSLVIDFDLEILNLTGGEKVNE